MAYLEKNVMDLIELIDSSFDEETGTWSDEDRDVLKDLAREEIDPTLEKYAKAMKYYSNCADDIADEIKRLQARKKMFENKAEHIKGRLDFSINTLNKGSAYKTLNYTFSFRKSSSVEVDDKLNLDTLPDYFKTIKVEVSKTAIKDGCDVVDGTLIDKKTGVVLNGVKIVEKKSLNVK